MFRTLVGGTIFHGLVDTIDMGRRVFPNAGKPRTPHIQGVICSLGVLSMQHY